MNVHHLCVCVCVEKNCNSLDLTYGLISGDPG